MSTHIPNCITFSRNTKTIRFPSGIQHKFRGELLSTGADNEAEQLLRKWATYKGLMTPKDKILFY